MKSMDRLIVAALVLVGTVGPAFAGRPILVPEPATMTLFGLGAGGAYLVKRFIGRNKRPSMGKPPRGRKTARRFFIALTSDRKNHPLPAIFLHYDAAALRG